MNTLRTFKLLISLVLATATCTYTKDDKPMHATVRAKLDAIEQKKVLSDLMLAQTTLERKICSLEQHISVLLLLQDAHKNREASQQVSQEQQGSAVAETLVTYNQHKVLEALIAYNQDRLKRVRKDLAAQKTLNATLQECMPAFLAISHEIHVLTKR